MSWKAAIKKASNDYRLKGKSAAHPKARASRKRAARYYGSGKQRAGSSVRRLLKRKKVSGTRKARRRLGAVNKSHKDGIDRKKVDITIGKITNAQALHLVKARYNEKLAQLLLRRDQAKLVTKKRRLTKQINEIRAKVNKLG